MLESTYENIIKAQSGDKDALDELVKNNMGLVYNIARRFVGRGYEIDDINGDVDILSVSPTKMEWKYDDGDIVTFRKRITE